MIAIGYHNFGIIFFDRDNDPLSRLYRVDLFFIYDNTDIQETEKNLFLSGDDNMIQLRNNARFKFCLLQLIGSSKTKLFNI